MKKAVKRRDLEFFIGMTLAHKMWMHARTHLHMTISEFLIYALGSEGHEKDEMVGMFLEVAERHADSIVSTMENEESQTVQLINDHLSEEDQYDLIKQSTVMSAVSEGLLMLKSQTPDDLDLPKPDDINPENHKSVIRQILDGFDPDMIKTIADAIIEESYPKERPTRDIIAALWMEGFTITALAQQTFESSKEDSFTTTLMAKAEKFFIVID